MSAELLIHGALSLPAVSVSPSVNCLQFSQDGQAVLLTKYAVYILTPDVGISVNLSSITQQAPEAQSPSRRPLGWLRTMLEFDRALTHQWPTDCAEWAAVSLGSLDPSLQAVALSPSNLTTEAGCVLALLNSNLELTIWSATKNLLTGEWIMLQNVTDAMHTATAAKPAGSALKETLRMQSTCVEWSSQPDWNHTPALLVDASLLAVGNRAGSVTFLRYRQKERQMALIEEVPVTDRWITHLAWSAWRLSQEGTCEALLSCGTSDGSVVVLTVRQGLRPPTQDASDHELSTSVQVQDEQASERDGRSITGIRWANSRARSTPILIFHKPGVVHLWSAPESESPWTGSRALLLRTHKRSVGSSALSPVAGISYIPAHDLAVVTLSDGSFYAIHKISVNPTLEPPSPAAIRFTTLSDVSRSVFVRTESESATFKDLDRTNGAVAYDGGSTLMWAYEATRPTDFNYKHDAKHVSTMVVAQLWDEDLDETTIVDLTERIGHAQGVSGEAPLSILRPIFLHLRDPGRVARMHTRILDALRHVPCLGAAPVVSCPTFAGAWTAELSKALGNSLATHFFGWNSIRSQRIRYAISVFCQNLAEAPDVQERFANAAELFLAAVRVHIQMVLIRHLMGLGGLLSGNAYDTYFARRVAHQSLATPGAPPALSQEAEVLLATLPSEPHPDTSNGTGELVHGGNDGLDESCPACSSPIPLQPPDADSAVCMNGHVWARCCVTSFVLATPRVRTCIGCSRKAFLAPRASAAPGPEEGGDQIGDPVRATAPAPVPRGTGGLPSYARGSRVVQDLLDAVRRCPYCGNNFVVLV